MLNLNLPEKKEMIRYDLKITEVVLKASLKLKDRK